MTNESNIKSPVTFSTHPNAPVVINYFTTRGNRKFHNRNPWQCKYASREGAAWLLATMQRIAGFERTYYIAQA